MKKQDGDRKNSQPIFFSFSKNFLFSALLLPIALLLANSDVAVSAPLCSEQFSTPDAKSIIDSLSGTYEQSLRTYARSIVTELAQSHEIQTPDTIQFYGELGFNLARLAEAARGNRQLDMDQLLAEKAIPRLSELVQNMIEVQKKYLNQWNEENPNSTFRIEDLIEIGVPHYNPKTRDWLTTDFFSSPPLGFEPFETSAISQRFVLVPGKGLYPALASGKFPILVNSLMHEFLGHFMGYIKNPDYAHVYRRIAQRVVELGGWTQLNHSQRLRLTHFNELFVKASVRIVRQKIHLFHLPSSDSSPIPLVGNFGYSKEILLAEIRKLTTTELIKAAQNIADLSNRVFQRIGGGAAEPGMAIGASFSTRSSAVRSLANRLLNSPDLPMGSVEKLQDDLAALEHMILISAELPMSSYYELVLAEKDGPMHQIFKEAGIPM